ncbi:MAG: hypothetical protein M1839_004787 [Geoglossum umbratile]|nr:MAG: hypothetical protein M1839_004787 [Geoglossum umbratile]
MAGIINGISFGVLVLSLFPLAKSFFPEPYKATTVVRIATGLSRSGESDSNTGGNQPGIGVFDSNGERIGFLSGTKKEYISVSGGGDDAICISYIAVTTPSGANFQFYGDVPKQCGAAWYHSNTYVTLQQSYTYYPSCIWIASSHKDGTRSGNFPEGFAYRIIDFASGNEARAKQYVDKPETMCQSTPRFKMYNNLTEMNCVPFFNPPLQPAADFSDADLNALKTDGKLACDPAPGQELTYKKKMELQKGVCFPRGGCVTGYGVKKRDDELDDELDDESIVPRADTKANGCTPGRLVVSNLDAHTATELCNSTTSAGPDFISMKENLYCDMCTHQIWPLCKDGTQAGCFDKETKAMRPGTGPHARDLLSGRDVPDKKYDTVTVWG